MADPASFVPSRPSFATQSGALLRKNIRYQKKNWCAPQLGGFRGAAAAAQHFRGTLRGLRLLTCSAAARAAAAQENQLLPGAHAAGLLGRAWRCVCAASAWATGAALCGAAGTTHPFAPLRPRRAVVSFVINNILLNQPAFKCGCLCSAYTTPDGKYTFQFSQARTPGACFSTLSCSV